MSPRREGDVPKCATLVFRIPRSGVGRFLSAVLTFDDQPPTIHLRKTAVQPQNTTIHWKTLYLPANSMLPFPMFSWPSASPSPITPPICLPLVSSPSELPAFGALSVKFHLLSRLARVERARRDAKPCRIRTYKKHSHYSFRIRTYKTQDLKFFRMNTSEKTGGRAIPGGPFAVWPALQQGIPDAKLATWSASHQSPVTEFLRAILPTVCATEGPISPHAPAGGSESLDHIAGNLQCRHAFCGSQRPRRPRREGRYRMWRRAEIGRAHV